MEMYCTIILFLLVWCVAHAASLIEDAQFMHATLVSCRILRLEYNMLFILPKRYLLLPKEHILLPKKCAHEI
jgi:hypothetical protein